MTPPRDEAKLEWVAVVPYDSKWDIGSYTAGKREFVRRVLASVGIELGAR